MRKLIILAAFILVGMMVGISGCASDNDLFIMPGADRDEHGCLGSAGYSWCERTDQCERPWELAKEKGFEATNEQFYLYCKG